MTEDSVIRVALCPQCGHELNADSNTCPSCHHEVNIQQEEQRETLAPSESSQLAQLTSEAAEVLTGVEKTSAALSVHNLTDASEKDGTEKESARAIEDDAAEEASPGASGDRSMSDGDWDIGSEDDPGKDYGPDPLIGVVIAGRYRIVELIGRGGMGVVYKVEHTEIGKMLALKLLAGEISQQREVIKRFKREALLTSKLSHPNSVQVFDFGTSEGLTFLVMELVVGRDLGHIIRKEGPLPAVRLAKIIVQVCSALAEAHVLGIVHRDIKPENILLSRVRDEFEMVKVLDFGLAKLRESSELNAVTGTGQIIGTPYYMSPEQIHGTDVDARTDIYSLGAVMYEALTRQQVFQAHTPMGVLTRHLTELPKPMREVLPQAPPPQEMEEIVLRCLEKDPGARYQRVEDLQEALVSFLHELGLSGTDMLLSNEELAKLQTALGQDTAKHTGSGPRWRHKGQPQIATRDEVAAFYRKLARDRWLGIGGLSLALLAMAGGVTRYLTRPKAPVPFRGLEKEPDNIPNQATKVPFDTQVSGLIGKRLSKERGDQDFFRVVVPPAVKRVHLTNSGLPNMAVCTWLFVEGQAEPVGRYCSGRPGAVLDIRSLRVEPGPYLLLVKQDRAKYFRREAPAIMENVSDRYTLRMAASKQDPVRWEIERNDSASSATIVKIGGKVSGRFEWHGDIDVVCVRETAPGSLIQWTVIDAAESPRARGAVLEVTRQYGPDAGASFRVHSRANPAHEPDNRDVVSPWHSAVVHASSLETMCLTLKLTMDPWAGPRAPNTLPVTDEPWEIRVEHAVEKHEKKKHGHRK